MTVATDAENQYPRQGLLNRNCVREKHRFRKVTSLNRTLFEGRPSPLAGSRSKERPGWLERRSIYPRNQNLAARPLVAALVVEPEVELGLRRAKSPGSWRPNTMRRSPAASQRWIRPPHSGMWRSSRRLPTPSPRATWKLVGRPWCLSRGKQRVTPCSGSAVQPSTMRVNVAAVGSRLFVSR
jgi:hypothetical protein